MNLEHRRILLELAYGLTRGCEYRAEWNLKPEHPAYVIDGSKPTLYEIRDAGWVEELADLHERWRLTRDGASKVLRILGEMRDACLLHIDELENTDVPTA